MASGKSSILAVGGGKGGVGKSVVSANLALSLAEKGKRTILVDVDLGGANLHTLFDIKTTTIGVGDFLYGPRTANLADFAMDIGIKNLRFISGNGFIPGIANLEYMRKLRLLKALQHLDYDYVVLDLGAGSSYNVIDFISITQFAIIVTIIEPTAVLNAYEFIKNIVFRTLGRHFANRKEIMVMINSFKTRHNEVGVVTMNALCDFVAQVNPEAAAEIRQITASFRPVLIVNMNPGDTCKLGQSLVDISWHFLGVHINFLGSIPYDSIVQRATLKMRPFFIDDPHSKPSEAIRSITEKLILSGCHDVPITDEYVSIEENMPEDAPTAEKIKPKGGTDANWLAGHGDSELSLLLGTLLRTSPGRVVSDQTHVAATAEAGAGTVQAPAPEPDGATETVELFIEPRLPHGAKQPFFEISAEMPPERDPSRSAFKDFMAYFNRDKRRELRAIQLLSQIQRHPGRHHVEPIMNLLKVTAPHTAVVGWQWIRVGLALLKAQQYSAAMHAFSQALVCLPGNNIALNNWAALQMLHNPPKPILTALTNQVGLFPNSGCLWYNMAIVQLMLKDYASAIPSLNKAVECLQQHAVPPPAMFLKAYCLFQTADYAAAGEMFLKLVQTKGAAVHHANFNLGLCQLRLGQNDQAIETFTKCLEATNNDAEAFGARGLAFWRSQKTDQAVADFSRAIQIDPGSFKYERQPAPSPGQP